MEARFLGIPVWDLKLAPNRRRAEARAILTVQWQARIEIAKMHNCNPAEVLLPEF